VFQKINHVYCILKAINSNIHLSLFDVLKWTVYTDLV
jgi:hypothetical protein